jgi:hypothetical protein
VLHHDAIARAPEASRQLAAVRVGDDVADLLQRRHEAVQQDGAVVLRVDRSGEGPEASLDAQDRQTTAERREAGCGRRQRVIDGSDGRDRNDALQCDFQLCAARDVSRVVGVLQQQDRHDLLNNKLLIRRYCFEICWWC